MVETGAVGAVEVTGVALGVVEQGVQDAAAFLETVELPGHLDGIALEEHPSEEGGGAVFGRQEDAVAGPGEAAVGFVDIDPEVERREARDLPEFLGGELIQGDLVTEAALGRSPCGGQEAVLGAVSAGDVRMGEAAEDREVVAEGGQRSQVRRSGVAATRLRGEELGGEYAEVVRNEQHPLGRCRGFLASEDRRETAEEGQGEESAGSAEEATTGERAGDVRGFHDQRGGPRKRGLWMKPCSRSRTRYSSWAQASKMASIFGRSAKRTGVPVA